MSPKLLKDFTETVKGFLLMSFKVGNGWKAEGGGGGSGSKLG
jgi:hypothetical protein